MRARILFTLSAATLSVAGALVPSAHAQISTDTELEQAGIRLQEITEDYNEARLARRDLDEKLRNAHIAVERTETRLHETRADLGRAVRNLYMHPGAGLEAIFAARDFRALHRGSAFASRVVMSADGLILEIRKARAEVQGATAGVRLLRDEAKERELEIDRRRQAAADALLRTQTALAHADLGALDAARQARLEAAAGLAAQNITYNGPVRPSAMAAVRAAASQMGKPYQWGAEGPDSYDCSGLTLWAWRAGGVSLPHSSRAQYASLPKVPLSELAPGDLVFRGNPIHHVAIYKGDGVVIHSPQTGEVVREESVWALNPIGAARP